MIQFRIQSTPNPNARKYIVSQDLKTEGKVSYTSQEDCQHVPLAFKLLGFAGIQQVHLFENVLTVTQDGNYEWSELDQSIQEILMEMIDNHNVDFVDHLETQKTKVELSPNAASVKASFIITIPDK